MGRASESRDTSWWKMNLRAVVGRAFPRVIGANREPSWVFFETFLPILGIAAYVYYYLAVGSAAGWSPEEIQVYMGYVIIGGAMTAYWLNVLWSMAAQFYWEKEMGNLEIYMTAPISRMAILGGMAIGGMFTTTIRAISIIVAGVLIFNIPLVLADPLMFVAIFAITLFALYGMGALFASLYLLWGREAWHTSNLLTEPIYLVSGINFPVKSLGMAVAAGASVIPVTLGLDAMRQLMYPAAGHGFLPVWIEFAALIVLSVLFIGFAKLSLDFMENRAKKEGKLVMRWQ